MHHDRDEALLSSTLEAQTRRDAFDPGQGDRFRALGSNMTLITALAAVEAQKKLTGPRKEAFARHLAIGTGKLIAEYQSKKTSRQELPLELPKALPTNKALRTAAGKKRAMAGLEAAEAEARAQDQQRRRVDAEEERERRA